MQFYLFIIYIPMDIKGVWNDIRTLTSSKDTLEELKIRKMKFPYKMWKGLEKAHKQKHQESEAERKMDGIIGRSDDKRKFMGKLFDDVGKIKKGIKKQKENEKRKKYCKSK